MNNNDAPLLTIHQGHTVGVLQTLPECSINTCVTSPPYYGLRDYDTEPVVWGGDPTHEHVWEQISNRKMQQLRLPDGPRKKEVWWKYREKTRQRGHGDSKGALCSCGAWLGSLGCEPSPDMFVQHLVEVFAAVRRVLTEDGTLWVVIGDSHASADYNGGLKPKDLVGIPWRTAFALQADGWYLRSDIIWAKPGPTPEPVTDRPTHSHEHIFLLAKSAKYYYNQDAIMERSSDKERPWRNKRDVWTVNMQPIADSHFASFPEALIAPCIMAGCPPGGTVLDPFCGSATTLLVARDLGCSGVGVELNPAYIKIAEKRLAQVAQGRYVSARTAEYVPRIFCGYCGLRDCKCVAVVG